MLRITLIYLIGMLSGLRTTQPVSLTRIHQGLREEGIQLKPDELTVADVLDRSVEEELSFLEAEGVVLLGKRGYVVARDHVGMVCQIHDLLDTGTNLTTAWCKQELREENYRKIVNYLNRKLPRSVLLGEIRDLVSEYFTRLMGRDGLRKYLEVGKIPAISQLGVWCYRQGLTIFRDEGRDALTRTSKGALNERETGAGAGLAYTAGDGLGHAPIYEEGEEGEGAPTPLLDVVDVSTLGEVDTEVEEKVAGLLEGEALQRTYDLMLSGARICDIARVFGVPRRKAHCYAEGVLERVREAANTGARSLRVVSYLREEPYSTYSEIAEEVGSEGLTEILDTLQYNRVISLQRGSYHLTERGVSLQREDSTGIAFQVAMTC